MFVSGLRNEALLKMTTNCSDAQAHEALRKCAQELRDNYMEKQQKKPEQSQKLGIKAHATEVLLCELGSKVPENPEAIRESIASALTLHAEMLKGHESSLSKKGNTYALMAQTRHLRRYGESASLLRYHDLKDKLLRHDSDLKPEVKEAISAAAKDKTLTLQDLETIDELLRTKESSSEMPSDDYNTQELLHKYVQKMQDRHKQRLMEMDISSELKDVPEDPDATREATASAQTRHAEMPQAHEQLLSKKVDTYALQTSSRKMRYDVSASTLSLSRYNYLTDKLLQPDTPMSLKLKKIVTILLEKNGTVTLQELETMDELLRTEESSSKIPSDDYDYLPTQEYKTYANG